MHRNGLQAALLGLVLSGAALASGLEVGAPFYRNHTPAEYSSFFQTWAVAQDAQGLIYVGNNLGVLQYDGSRWRLIRTTRERLVRSLASDPGGRVFVGTQGELGFLETRSGDTRFVSLLDQLPVADRGFTEVRTTLAVGRDIYFQARERLFRWRDGKFSRWLPRTGFLGAFSVRGQLYVQDQDHGLQVLKDDQLQRVKGGERFDRSRITGLLPLDPGRAGHSDLLVATRDEGLFRLGPGRVEPLFPAIRKTLAGDQISACDWLRDGTLVVATWKHGLFRLDPAGQVIGRFDKRDGLQDQDVKGLFQDAQGGVWLPLQRGVTRIEWPSQLSQFEEGRGVQGLVLCAVRHRGELLVGTDFGLYQLQDAPGAGAGLRPLASQCGGVWSTLPWDRDLLLATAEGVWLWDGARARPIYGNATAMALLRSRKDPDLLYVGLRSGLARLRRTASGWRDEGQVPGLLAQVRSIVEAEDGTLWLGTAADGVLRLRIAPEPRFRAAAIDPFGPGQGLPGLNHDYVYAFHDGLRVSSHSGIYRFDPARDRFEPDPRTQGLFADGPRWVYALREDAQGRIWMHSCDEARNRNESGVAVPQPDGSYRWQATPFIRFSGAWVESLLAEAGGPVWFCTWGGLIRYDPAAPAAPSPRLQTVVRGVRAGAGLSAIDAAAAPPVISHRNNRLRFEFAVPSYGMDGNTTFQVYLEGYDSAWGKASAEPFKDYNNLPAGSYRFRVRARTGTGQVSEDALYPFRILAPWHHTWWARLLGLALGAGLLAVYIRLRMSALRARNADLEARVRERTLDLASRNLELEALDATVKAVNREVAIQPLLEALLQQSQALFSQTEKGAIVIQDEEDGLFRVCATLGYAPGYHKEIAFTTAELLARYTRGSECLDQGVFRVSDLARAAGADHLGDLPLPLSLLAMSLSIQDQLVGFLVLENYSDPEAFRSADGEKLKRYREHAINALVKARIVERLEAAAAQLRGLDAQKNRFLGIVAHDLRNPLNGIMLAVDLLAEEDDLGLIHSTSGKIRREVQDMATLIDRYLGVAAIESGIIRAEQDVIDLVPVIRHLLARFGKRAANKSIELRFEPAQAWVPALGDERLFKEVLDNLLSNALKFSPRGRVVTVGLEASDGKVIVSISDQGPGLTAEDRKQLFSRYARLSAQPTAGETSVGLGLSIAFQLMTAMHGRIWAESEPGQGATFRLELPAPEI